jgi:cardiolipin synthase
MDYMSTSLVVGGYLLTLLLVPYAFFQTRKQPVSTLAWITAIVTLPYAGGLLFLLFGINRVERRAALKLASRQQIGRVVPGLARFQLLPGEALEPQVQRLLRLADRVSTTRCCFGNAVEILADTNRTLGLIEQAIGSAKQSIHLEYYIFRPDKTGYRLRDLLIRKATEGVKVRFLFDGVGSMFLGRRFLRPMVDAGITVASALPGASFRERWSINLRNHRKIVITDGTVGFTGGMNIGDEYIGRNMQFGYWRDTHLRMQGPAVLQLQQIFAEDWFFATGEQPAGPDWYPPTDQAGDQIAQVVAGGPDGDVDVFHSLFFAAINEASDRITLATSYFIPTPALVTALETAAHRGVRVRLMVPKYGDHRWMVVAGRGYYESLLESGVEIYEYHRGPLHCKTLTIDGLWSLVGTPNFDSRSLLLNFEVGAVLYGPKAAGQLEEQFADDLRQAPRVELASFRRRSRFHKLSEQVLKLFSPVL